MKRVLRRQKSGYAFSFTLGFFGLAALFWIFWKAWPVASTASSPISVFWESLWNKTLDFIPGVEFKLAYLTIFASAMLVAGFIVFGLSRKWFLLKGKNSLLQCRGVESAEERVPTRLWFSVLIVASWSPQYW